VFAVSAVAEALESVVWPLTVRAVAEAAARVVWPVTVRRDAVVVASVVVPVTASLPLAVRLPLASTRKLRFSVHADPFQ
jgi:hypothetical protein